MANTELEKLSVTITADTKGIESALVSLSKSANDNAGKMQAALSAINFDGLSKAVEKQINLNKSISENTRKFGGDARDAAKALQFLQNGFEGTTQEAVQLAQALVKSEKELESISNEAKKALTNLERLNGVGEKLGSFGRTAGLYLTAPLVLVGKHAISAASDMQELESKFQQVFKELTPQVQQWAATTGESVNRSKLDFMDYLSTLQAVFSGMGFARGEAAELSKSLSVLGVDLASFHNVSDPDAVRDLTSAITGEHETVKKYGVLLNDATIDQALFNMGIQGGTKDATELQKVLARFNVIMKSTKDAQGDAARTSESYANQLRGLQSELKEASAAMGAALLPAALEVVQSIKSMTEVFNGLSDGMKSFIVDVGLIGAILAPISLALSGLINVISAVTAGLAALGVTFASVLAAGPWIAAAAAIGGVVYWLTDLNAEAQKNEPLNSLEKNLKDVKSITDDLTFATKEEAKANLQAALAIAEKTKALIKEKQAQVQILGADRAGQTETFPNFRTGESGTVLGETGISKVSTDIADLNQALKETEDHASKVQSIIDNFGKGGGSTGGGSGSSKPVKSTGKKTGGDTGKTLDDFQKQIDLQLKLADAAHVSAAALQLEEEKQAILSEGFKGSADQLEKLAKARIEARKALGEGKEELDAIENNEKLRKSLEEQIRLNYSVAESAKATGASADQANAAIGLLDQGFKGTNEEALEFAKRLEDSEKGLSILSEKTIPKVNNQFERMFDQGLESIERKLIDGTASWRDILLDFSSDLQMEAFKNLNGIAKQFLFGQKDSLSKMQSGGGDGGLLGGLLGLINGGADQIGGNAGISDNVSAVPDFAGYYAEGGPIRAGKAAIVGEKGAELVVAKQDVHVFSNKQSQGIMNGGGRADNRSYNMNISFILPSNMTNIQSFMQAKSQISRALQQSLSRASQDI